MTNGSLGKMVDHGWNFFEDIKSVNKHFHQTVIFKFTLSGWGLSSHSSSYCSNEKEVFLTVWLYLKVQPYSKENVFLMRTGNRTVNSWKSNISQFKNMSSPKQFLQKIMFCLFTYVKLLNKSVWAIIFSSI